MKPKIILALIACPVIVIVLFIVGSVYHAMARITWQNQTGSGIKYFAEGIQRHRNEHDAYPSSLHELFAGSDKEWTDYMQQRVLNDQFHDNYEYQLQTNGFVIRVIRPSRWFMKGETLEKRYEVGEALK